MVIATHTHYLPEAPDFEQKFIATLDAAGVDRAVVMGNTGGAEPMNEYVVEFVKRFPDRIIGAAYLDPRETDAPEHLRKLVNEDGMRALKYISGVGFYPNDHAIYPVYEAALELGIPVMAHTCSVTAHLHLRQKYSQPIFLDDVARDFPALNIIVVHAGQSLLDQALVIGNLDNVYVETSSMGDPWMFEHNIRRLHGRYGADRLMFGGPDHNYENMQKTLDEMRAALAALKLSSADVDKVMGENAARLFPTL